MEKDPSKVTARDLGFHPRFEPMTRDQTGNLMAILMNEAEPQIPDSEMPFAIQILDKRVSVMNLPIKFTLKGKLAMWVLTDGNPGRMMTALIDCLTNHEGQEITAEIICELYPVGFYSENSLMDYVDNYIKTRQVKWSQIY